MADTKLADLTALTTPSGDDILYIVDDPAGTPLDRKIALDNLFTRGIITADAPVLNMSQTWNNGAVTFTGLKFNAAGTSDANSASGSLLMDLQVNTASKFKVQKNGYVFASFMSLGSTASELNLNYYQPGFGVSSTGQFTFSSAASASGADTILTRRAAANLRLGAADAAAPVAQTLSVQSGTAGASATTVSISGTALTIAGTITGTIAIGHAVTGTGVSANTLITAGSGTSWTVNNSQTVGPITMYFNSVGQNLTLTGSQGSGPSAGGSIIFQVAPAGSAATTAQNALQNVFLLPGVAGEARLVNSVGGSGNFNICSTSNVNVHLTFKHSTDASGNSGTTTGFIGRISGNFGFFDGGGSLILGQISGSADSIGIYGTDLRLARDDANKLALRNGANAQESRVYGSYTATDNYQRMSIKTLRESSGALSGASYTTTIAIPAYANLIGVTTRVTTAVTGATTYDVGDGSDVDLWGAAIGIALGSQSRTADFTAVAAVGAAATSRTVTLTANGSNFTGGVVEICLHYLTTEAD